MANAAEKRVVPDIPPVRKTMESGEFPVDAGGDRSPENQADAIRRMQADAVQDVDAATDTAVAYAESQGATDIAERMRQEADAARQEIQHASQDAFEEAGVTDVDAEEPKAPTSHPSESPTVEALPFAQERLDAINKELHQLEESGRVSGNPDTGAIRRLQEEKASLMKGIPPFVFDYDAFEDDFGGTVAMSAERQAEIARQSEANENAPESTIVEAAKPMADVVKKKRPPSATSAGGSEKKNSSRLGAAAVIGAGAGVFGIGKLFGYIDRAFDAAEKFLKRYEETDFVDRLRSVLAAPENALKWIADKMEGKASEKKSSEKKEH